MLGIRVPDGAPIKINCMKKCKVKNCNNESRSLNLCKKHYAHIRRYGEIIYRTNYDPNKIINCNGYYEICLYKKHKEIARTKIDKDDLKKVEKYRWYLDRGYAVSCGIGNKIMLHYLILGRKKGMLTDHINCNKLDNRKKNLRFVTCQQNNMNKKSKGYTFDKNRNKWQAHIKINYKYIWLGRFEKKEDAKKERRKAEKKYFGEYACDHK